MTQTDPPCVCILCDSGHGVHLELGTALQLGSAPPQRAIISAILIFEPAWLRGERGRKCVPGPWRQMARFFLRPTQDFASG